MIKRCVTAGRHARLLAQLALLMALGTLAACTQKREAPEASQTPRPRVAAAPPRCGLGLAAEDLAGNCRDKDCPTMGALEAEPPRPPAQPCPKPAARGPARPATKAPPT
jgi:hypothetical protein